VKYYWMFWHGNPAAAIFVHFCVAVVIASIVHEKLEDSRYQVPMKKGRDDYR